jgi:hypothetical protein
MRSLVVLAVALLVVLVGILAACGTAVEVDPAAKAAECKELGFDTALLACSSCALIPSYPPLPSSPLTPSLSLHHLFIMECRGPSR